jgi:hypothetical protein
MRPLSSLAFDELLKTGYRKAGMPKQIALVVVLIAATAAQRPNSTSQPRLSSEGKVRIAGTLQSVDSAQTRITFRTGDGQVLEQTLGAKLARSMQRHKKGERIILFTRELDGKRVVTDSCWRIGNSACGGSENDPCPSADLRRIYYKCVDDEGNELYYDDCEPDGCATASKPKRH